MDGANPGLVQRHVGQAIAVRRVESGFSRAELGEKLQIAEARVDRIERGIEHPSPQLLSKLANVLKKANPVVLRYLS
jgi:ribosome-binding protein aMBF1 (putative translation factor)